MSVGLARAAFGVVQGVSPALAARWGERIFFTPGRRTLSPEQQAVLSDGRRFTIVSEGRRLAAWSWGEGPIVYVAHGWGSRAGRLADCVAPLCAAGCRVVACDAPGHGESEGPYCSMPEYARALRVLVQESGPAWGLIGHSLGAAAGALAMWWGLVVRRAVFLAPAADPPGFMLPFARALGLSSGVVERIKRNSQRRIGVRWEDLRVPQFAPAISGVPLLVFHDRADAVVPYSDGEAIVAAWRGAELVGVTGLGHSDLARDPEVIARSVRFLQGGDGAR